ncbi:MAG: DUF362 domain-containing protein [Candidatus Omnitrophota bacterium]
MGTSQVSIVGCRNYNTIMVEKAVRKSVDLIGGINRFIKPGDRVLIKPNILSARKPEDAVCTHPEMVRAVIRLARRAGAYVTVGDSPGGFLKNMSEVYNVSGIGRIAREEKVNIVKFTFSRTVSGFPISVRVLDADKIISVPKFKTHEITGITAAVKNMFGAVVGLYKTKCHADAPTEKSLAKVLAQVYALTRPTLSILDAVVSMEGEGPSAGVPRHTGFVMASADGVAIDSLLSVLIGLRPHHFAVTRECRRMGLGETAVENIDVLGDTFSNFMIRNFKHARGRAFLRLLPGPVTNMIASQLRFWPEIDPELCKKCNMCKSSCPVHAISVKGGLYEVNRSMCIRCMCCREICPYKAIGVRKSWLAKLLWE